MRWADANAFDDTNIDTDIHAHANSLTNSHELPNFKSNIDAHTNEQPNQLSNFY